MRETVVLASGGGRKLLRFAKAQKHRDWILSNYGYRCRTGPSFLSRTGPPRRTRLATTILQPALPGSVRSNRPASGSLSQGSQSQDEQFEVALHRSRQTHRVPPTELATGMPFHLSKTGRSWPARARRCRASEAARTEVGAADERAARTHRAALLSSDSQVGAGQSRQVCAASVGAAHGVSVRRSAGYR